MSVERVNPPRTRKARGEMLAKQRDTLHLGCGENHIDGAVNVDVVTSVDPDLVWDLEERPWPFPARSFDRILAAHVFEHLTDLPAALEECERVLQPGGELVVRHPIGLDFDDDPDHEPSNRWGWNTPLWLCGERHWDRDVGLEVTDRDVTLWAQRPGFEKHIQQAWLDFWMDHAGPGRWCFDTAMTSGEFVVTFRKP